MNGPAPERPAAETPAPAVPAPEETVTADPVPTATEYIEALDVAPESLPVRPAGASLDWSHIDGLVRFVDYLVERDWGCYGGAMEPTIFGIPSKIIPPGRFLEDGGYRLPDGTVLQPYWEYADGALLLGLDGDDPVRVVVPEIIAVPGSEIVWFEHPGKPELDSYTQITFDRGSMHGLVGEYPDQSAEQSEYFGSQVSCQGQARGTKAAGATHLAAMTEEIVAAPVVPQALADLVESMRTLENSDTADLHILRFGMIVTYVKVVDARFKAEPLLTEILTLRAALAITDEDHTRVNDQETITAERADLRDDTLTR